MKKLIILLVAISANSCSIGFRINKADRCEVKNVKMYWIDGSISNMKIQTCRWGRQFVD